MDRELEGFTEVETVTQESYKDSLIKLQGEKIQLLENRVRELEAQKSNPRPQYIPPPRMSKSTIVSKLEEKYGRRSKVFDRQDGADTNIRPSESEQSD